MTSRRSEVDPDVTDLSVYLSMQSIRLNVDQDTLFFLINFAGALSPDQQRADGGVGAANRGLKYLSTGEGGRAVRFSAAGAEETLEILPEVGQEEEEEDAVLPPPSTDAPEVGEEVFEDAVGSLDEEGSPSGKKGLSGIQILLLCSSSSSSSRLPNQYWYRYGHTLGGDTSGSQQWGGGVGCRPLGCSEVFHITNISLT